MTLVYDLSDIPDEIKREIAQQRKDRTTSTRALHHWIRKEGYLITHGDLLRLFDEVDRDYGS